MWDTGKNLRACMLSDDTPMQKAQSTYYYTQGSVSDCGLYSNGYQQVGVAS